MTNTQPKYTATPSTHTPTLLPEGFDMPYYEQALTAAEQLRAAAKDRVKYGR